MQSKGILIGCLVLSVLAVVQIGCKSNGHEASASPALDEPREIWEFATVTARVDAVDLARREMTLTGPFGNTLTFAVDQRVRRLEQENVHLFFGNRPVLDATRNDQKLALLQPYVVIAEFHPKSALDHQEQLVLVIVMMPDERLGKLDQLDVLPVQLTDDPWLEIVIEQGQFLSNVDLFHNALHR